MKGNKIVLSLLEINAFIMALSKLLSIYNNKGNAFLLISYNIFYVLSYVLILTITITESITLYKTFRDDSNSLSRMISVVRFISMILVCMRVCQNSFSAKDSYHFVKNNRYQRVNNSMITVTLIFMRE